MRLGVGVRMLIGFVVAAVVGNIYFQWSLQIGANIVRSYRGSSYIDCSPPTGIVLGTCDPSVFSATWGWVALVVLGLLMLAVLRALILWTLRPLRAVTASVNRLGPQNLTERNGLTGRDPLVALARAIDAMLDRVSEGYEGQRRFAANASHELRTPLAVQRTLIEVSMSADLGPAQIELLSRQLLATNERNEDLIEGLLVLAESDRGLASSTPQRLDLVAKDVVARHRHSAEGAGVTLVVEAEQVVVDGELALLERLVANLVQNAIKYNLEGGSVTLVLDGGADSLTVSNTGPVVPGEAVNGLFEPFRRYGSDRLNHREGSGLGLTIVRSIASAHGGTVTATAQPAGGLRVIVRLPAG